jgi:hypothetical protein
MSIPAFIPIPPETYSIYTGPEKLNCVICLEDEKKGKLYTHGRCLTAVHAKCMNNSVKTVTNRPPSENNPNYNTPCCSSCRDSTKIKWEHIPSPKQAALDQQETHFVNRWVIPTLSFAAQQVLSPYASIAFTAAATTAAVMHKMGNSTGRVAAASVAGAALRSLASKKGAEAVLVAAAGAAGLSIAGSILGAGINYALKKAKISMNSTIVNSVKGVTSSVNGLKCAAAILWLTLGAQAANLI